MHAACRQGRHSGDNTEWGWVGLLAREASLQEGRDSGGLLGGSEDPWPAPGLESREQSSYVFAQLWKVLCSEAARHAEGSQYMCGTCMHRKVLLIPQYLNTPIPQGSVPWAPEQRGSARYASTEHSVQHRHTSDQPLGRCRIAPHQPVFAVDCSHLILRIRAMCALLPACHVSAPCLMALVSG